MNSPILPTSKFADVLEAHVVGFGKKTHAKRKKQYAVYSIDVSLAAAQWTVQRRFSEFVKFNSNIKSAFPTLRFLTIPSRLHKSLDSSFLEKRRQKLNSFMIDVLDQVPLVVPILKCEIIMQFLDVMKNVEKHFALDKRTRGREMFPDLYASFPFNKKTIHLTIQHGMDKGEDIPIHLASKEGNCDEVSAIVRSNPQAMFVTDYLGQTALHIASRHGQAPVVRLLLVLGANRNIQDKRGWAPLHCACTSADLQTVLTLLEDEAVIPDLQNVDGNTPLHYFVRNFSSAPADMLKDVLAIFTRKGCDINSQNKSGETPLHHACWRGSFPLVVALLSGNADPNLLTVTEESALQWAVREGRTNIGLFLIQNGARNDRSIFDASTPPRVVEQPSDDVALEEDDFDDDDGSDDSDDEGSEKAKNGKSSKHKHSYDSMDSSSPSCTPPSTALSTSSSPSHSPSPSSSITPPHVSPPNISPPTHISPPNNNNNSPPAQNTAWVQSTKFVAGSHSRNQAPSPFLPVLASPKRLLRPAEHVAPDQQLQNQIQHSPDSQITHPQLTQAEISQLPQNPQLSIISENDQDSQKSQEQITNNSPPSYISPQSTPTEPTQFVITKDDESSLPLPLSSSPPTALHATPDQPTPLIPPSHPSSLPTTQTRAGAGALRRRPRSLGLPPSPPLAFTKASMDEAFKKMDGEASNTDFGNTENSHSNTENSNADSNSDAATTEISNGVASIQVSNAEEQGQMYDKNVANIT